MNSFNTSEFPPSTLSGFFVEKHITVQAATEVSGYNSQYLRRLLRAGKLKGIKIGQVWLIDLASLEAYFEWANREEDHRCGPQDTKTRGVYTLVNGHCLQAYTGSQKGGPP